MPDQTEQQPEHVRKPVEGGPDICMSCSQAAQEYVTWPCSPDKLIRAFNSRQLWWNSAREELERYFQQIERFKVEERDVVFLIVSKTELDVIKQDIERLVDELITFGERESKNAEEAQAHIHKWLTDNNPEEQQPDGSTLTGDLAIDMAHYASRLRKKLEYEWERAEAAGLGIGLER